MKKMFLLLALMMVAAVTFYPIEGIAQSGPGGYEGGYCPYCGQYTGPGYGMGPYGMGPGYGRGPGMMGHGGYGMRYGRGPGMMGRGGYGMGPGYGQGPGYGMGPGMMGHGYGPGYDRRYGPEYQYHQYPQKSLDKDQAKEEVQDYLNAGRNPNLKIGKIEDKGNDFEVDVVTKDGSLVDKILVDKDTGWMRSAY